MTAAPTLVLETAIAALQPTFVQVDRVVQANLGRVLAALRAHRVGTHHFAGVNGYGHGDLGRDTFDQVFAQVVGAEQALVRLQFFSGTHAIAAALFGVLRPGDRLVAAAGRPYDTLEEVIGLRGSGQGSLAEWGVTYREVDLTATGDLDWEALAEAVRPPTRLLLIQRSCGYSWRPSLTLAQIERLVDLAHRHNPDVVCLVDNCYGEFVATSEPPAVGADLIAGSLIKNPGGTIVPCGGYVAGRPEWVEAAACRLTAPGIGSHGGATLEHNRLLYQGLFLAPQMVGEALKGGLLVAEVFSRLGYAVNPMPGWPRHDVIQAIQLGSPEQLIQVCRVLQQHSPVGSYLDPVPGEQPGYDSELIMAGGTFIDGSTAELSADGPLRPPYTLFCQGGTHWTHWAIALEALLPTLQP